MTARVPDDVPRQGELWIVDLGDPVGHEQGFRRPGLIVSVDEANRRNLVVVCPLTRTGTSRAGTRIPSRIEVETVDSGLRETSYVQTDQPRAVSRDRLVGRSGRVDPHTQLQVFRALARLFGLPRP